MPVVMVEMWKGRTEEQKAKLIKGITKAFEEIGVEADYLSIVIHDIPKSNWGMGGGTSIQVSSITNLQFEARLSEHYSTTPFPKYR